MANVALGVPQVLSSFLMVSLLIPNIVQGMSANDNIYRSLSG